MMMRREIDDLLHYLDLLVQAEKAGYRCSKEIRECIGAIRKELDLKSEFKFETEGSFTISRSTDTSKIAETLAKKINEAGERNA
jgi:hypothetical protein